MSDYLLMKLRPGRGAAGGITARSWRGGASPTPLGRPASSWGRRAQASVPRLFLCPFWLWGSCALCISIKGRCPRHPPPAFRPPFSFAASLHPCTPAALGDPGFPGRCPPPAMNSWLRSCLSPLGVPSRRNLTPEAAHVLMTVVGPAGTTCDHTDSSKTVSRQEPPSLPSGQ